MVNVTRGFHGFDPQQPLRHTTSQHPRLQGAAGRTQQESQTGKLGLPLSLRNPYVCIYGYIDIIHACVCMYIHIYIYVYIYIYIIYIYICRFNLKMALYICTSLFFMSIIVFIILQIINMYMMIYIFLCSCFKRCTFTLMFSLMYSFRRQQGWPSIGEWP